MENNEIRGLIQVFKDYRDLLSPIQMSLKGFADSFESIREDLLKLNR